MADTLIEDILSTYEEKTFSELQASIAKLDSEIHNNVTHHHSDLLAQTSNVELLDDVVIKTLSRTKASLTSVNKLKSNLEQLYSNLDSTVHKLEYLHEARRNVAIFEQVLKYNELIEGERNLGDVALYVRNIDFLCSTAKLDQLKPFGEKAISLSQNIEKQTENMLIQGLNAKSYNQVSSSIQIFVNLDTLNVKVTKIVGEAEKLIEKDVKSCLKMKFGAETSSNQPGRAFKPSETNKKQVWSNLETMVAKILNHTSRVKLLFHVLRTGKDLNSNSLFETFCDDQIWPKFWNVLQETLIQNFNSVQPEFVKTLFEDEFQKLLAIVSTMGNQIEDCSGLNISVSLKSGLRGVLLNYEKAFLSKSLAKLFDTVNYIFARSTCPTKKEIESVIRIINKEISVEDPMLKKLVSRNISKTVQLVCVRAEQLICNDGNSTQVIGAASESQISNAQLVNALDHFKSQLLPEYTDPVSTLMRNILNPLCQAIGDSVDAIVLTLHQESFKRTSRTTDYSLYMGELSSFISRVGKDYFSLYSSNDILQKSSFELARRTIISLITNITLIPNLTSETKRQLLVDLNHVEIALTPICPVLQEALRFLRAFRSIFQMSVEEVRTSSLVGSVIPDSYVLHLLIGQTGGRIQSPLTMNNWSIPRYIRWLESHTEEDKIILLKSCLENYVQGVTSKGQTEFHSNYPVLVEMMRKPHLQSYSRSSQ